MASPTDGAVAALTRARGALGGAEGQSRNVRVGVKLKATGTGAVRLGSDRGFSGWRRGAPIQIEVAFSVHRDGSGISMHRSRKTAGMFRVAEEGRNGAVRTRGVKGGQRRRQRDGSYRVSVARAKRRVGWMAPKYQWTKATGAMRRQASTVLTEETARDVLLAFEGRR